ncbi:FAD-binding monooxygenase tazF [Exophiala dermatitidis]
MAISAENITDELPPLPAEHANGVPTPNTTSSPERRVKAIIVGAGIGGISAAVLLSHKVNNLTYTLYDKNERVGGTWAENCYPGVRCDVPSHVYQLTFAPNPNWSEYYAKGSEIQQYYEGVARDYGVTPNLKLRHEVLSARWNSDEYQWEFEIKDLSSGTVFKDTAEFFISSPGRVNQPNIPPFEGVDNFQGPVIHTARWDPKIDLKGKRVAIIGNGASGQQILPNIVDQVAHIDHYVRGKTYVSPTFRQGLLEASVDIPGGYVYTEEEKQRFREDPEALLAYRNELEKTHYRAINNTFGVIGSKGNEEFRQELLKTMLDRLNGDREWLERLTPDYGPGCKRLTPAPGYLEAIIGPKVEFIDTPIKRITTTGVETVDGNLRNVDIVILATGFKDGFYPRFPTILKNGDDLAQIWRPGGKIGFPETYLGVAAPNAPNYFFILLAQGNAFGGSVPYQCEISATYIARLIRKVQREGYRALHPTEAAAKDFSVVVDQYFDKSVVNDNCRTYFKLEDKVGKSRNVLGYPGTTRQRLEFLSEPRWEDFIFEDGNGNVVAPVDTLGSDKNASATSNRFLRFWGNGRSPLDDEDSLDSITAEFLTEPAKIDLRTWHEKI